MINAGDFLKSPAMRSSGAVTGTRTTMLVRSISTTTGLTTRTTTSVSADPKITCLDIRLADGKPILGRKSPGDSPKARQHAKPVTVAGPIGSATEDGRPSFHELTSIENLYQCWLMAKKGKSQSLRMLAPRELFRAQGFTDDYIIDTVPDWEKLFVDGHQVADVHSIPWRPLTKSAQVRMCGNSVCPPLACALIEANFTHEREIARVA